MKRGMEARSVVRARRRWLTRRRFLGALTASAGACLGMGLYTWRWEPHWIEVVQRRLPVAHLPTRLAYTSLVQLSDLHLGPRVDDAYLLKVFDLVMQFAPQFVVYTGDFATYQPDIVKHARRMFAHLPHGTRGTFGILGNHDYGPHWSHPEIATAIATAASDAGVRMLRNEVAEMDGLQICGLDDLWADQFDAERGLAGLDPRGASLVLSHNPDTVDHPVWGGYAGWILCGHTHGGQCKPPFLPPPLLPVRNRTYTAGEFTLSGGRRMYISRGVGHLLRVRFNVRPEVTVFELVQA